MNRKIIGSILVFGPPVGLIGSLVGYAVASFVLSTLIASQDGDSSTVLVAGQLINVLLGFVGLISIAGLLVGIPVGLYLLATADEKPQK